MRFVVLKSRLKRRTKNKCSRDGTTRIDGWSDKKKWAEKQRDKR